MKIALILCQDIPKVVWNAFRLSNMMLEGMEDVTIFLNGPCVKYESMDSKQFLLRELSKIFTPKENAWTII